MRRNLPILLCLGVCVAGLLSPAAEALDFKFKRPAMRAGIGAGVVQIKDDPLDLHASEWTLFVGADFYEYFAAEVGRMESGTASQVLTGGQILQLKQSAWFGSVVGSYPFYRSAFAFGRVGFMSWRAGQTLIGGTGATVENTDGSDPYYGLGVGWELDNGQLRLEYDKSTIDDVDATHIAFSAVWKF